MEGCYNQSAGGFKAVNQFKYGNTVQFPIQAEFVLDMDNIRSNFNSSVDSKTV
jgi:hypothetical protein